MISKLCNYVYLSPNYDVGRTEEVKGIAIHHMAGDLTVEQCGRIFANPDREASSNYGIGSDGRIACYVKEEDRSWCTGGEWDNHLITIEVANCSSEPDWEISKDAMTSLIELCADICKRYDIIPICTGNKEDSTIVFHRWYQATLCPGPYIVDNIDNIIEGINHIIGFTGWKLIDYNWYYFDCGNMVTNKWVASKGSWYYLGEDGVMLSDEWLKYKDKWYYLSHEGSALCEEWSKLAWNDKVDWYYFGSNCDMVVNTWVDDYFLGFDGAMMYNIWIGHNNMYYWVGEDGKWIDKPSWKSKGNPEDGYPIYEY